MSDTTTVTAVADLHPFALARRAECSDPDDATSVGAKWLQLVASAAGELLSEGLDADDLSDRLHEVADSLVPVYTHERWQVFSDIAAWQEDLSDFGNAFGGAADMTDAAGVALYVIAERLVSGLVDEFGTRTAYVAGWNTPGYMPDTVDEFETFEEAKQFILDELAFVADNAQSWNEPHDCDDCPCPTFGDDCPNDRAGAITLLAEEVNLETGPFEVYIGEYCYFVAQAQED